MDAARGTRRSRNERAGSRMPHSSRLAVFDEPPRRRENKAARRATPRHVALRPLVTLDAVNSRFELPVAREPLPPPPSVTQPPATTSSTVHRQRNATAPDVDDRGFRCRPWPRPRPRRIHVRPYSSSDALQLTENSHAARFSSNRIVPCRAVPWATRCRSDDATAVFRDSRGICEYEYEYADWPTIGRLPTRLASNA